MARFCSNENIAFQVVVELRRLGHDVLTSLDADRANSAVPDSELLAFAAADRGILLSHKRRDFLQLHRHREKPHAGMVLCTFDPDFVGQAQRIHAEVASGTDITNELIRVNRPNQPGK